MTTAELNISSAKSSASEGTPLKVLLAAGGTGGHVYPAIAIADELKRSRPDADILFVGTKDRMEWEAVPRSGYDIKSVWISGFHRRLTPQNLLFPFKLITSIIQSVSILKQFKPDVLVACGGFAAGPVGWVASKMGIPIVIQEQNSYPGVTNRLLAKHAKLIFTAFDGAAKFLPDEKVWLEGNPVRKQLTAANKKDSVKAYGFKEKHPVLLVMGGSGGAAAINSAMLENLEELHDALGIQIIWQCGPRYFDELNKKLSEETYPNVRLTAYIDDMSLAYGAADLVLTRSGASTCSELMLLGQPAIFVPSPNVAGDHQAKNASSMVKAGAAILLKEEDMEMEMTSIIKKIIFSEKKLNKMSDSMLQMAKPRAASNIATEIINLVEK